MNDNDIGEIERLIKELREETLKTTSSIIWHTNIKAKAADDAGVKECESRIEQGYAELSYIIQKLDDLTRVYDYAISERDPELQISNK